MYIQDPLYGGYKLRDKIIEELMSTFEISRLASVKQANLTSLVFPGANHTRFEHTLGTVYLMDS
jgi:HD superfamily phosphohydrolase